MASISEKKSEQVAVKLAPATLEMIEQICQIEDRPVGYVVRELMVRGLSQYQIDGRLRDLPQPERHLAPVVATIAPANERSDAQRMIDDVPLLSRKAK